MLNKSDSIIKCPSCGKVLFKNSDKKMFSCENNHCFDIAKQGYINLLMSNKEKTKVHGDSSEMLLARKEILDNGYYSGISGLLNSIVKNNTSNNTSSSILDLGSGIGYYLKELKQSLGTDKFDYYGIDISKTGVLEASKRDKEISWIVGSNNKLPYLDNSMDILISVFAPFTLSECERVLKNNGLLLVISPNQDHLIELKEVIYENIIPKKEDRNEFESNVFNKVSIHNLRNKILINKKDIKSLLLMTPHYWKTSEESKSRLYELVSLEVTIDIELKIYNIM